MDNTNQKRRNRLFEKHLNIIFREPSKFGLHGGIITVTAARIAPDSKTGKIYLSFFKFGEKTDEDCLQDIKNNYPLIRQFLWQQIRRQIRTLPELTFYIDNTQQEIENIENILNKLNIQK